MARPFAMLLVLATWGVHGESLPSKGKVDPRIRTALYNPEQIYRLYGFVGYAIELIFEDGETYAGEGGGDLDGIAIGSHANHLVLKPKAPNVGTNLVIFTTRRAYRFEYSASRRTPDPMTDEVMYAVRFLYAPPTGMTHTGPTPAEQAELELTQASASRPRNLDYWYCGSPSIKPTAASDDGVHTRLTFGAKAELPAIFVRNDDGSESLLNFSVADGDVIIHRVAARLILRRGELTGCIVNKAFSGGGERLESGTIAPRVERERKGPLP